MDQQIVLQSLIQSARNATRRESMDNLLQTTREAFRPKQRVFKEFRGRRRNVVWKKDIFLFRRSTVDFFPSSSEVHHLSSCGLGKPAEAVAINRNWSIHMLESYIYTLYPKVPDLERIGFKFARRDRQNKIIVLSNIESITELDSQIRKSILLLVPNQDLPIILPVSVSNNNYPSRIPRRSEVIENTHHINYFQSNSPRRGEELENTHDIINYPSNSLTREEVAEHTIEISSENISRQQSFERSIREYEDIYQETSFDFDEVDDRNSFEDSVFPELPANCEKVILNVPRLNCVKTMFQFYKEHDQASEKRLSVMFIGESGIDRGGLTKELFNLFFKEVEEEYFRGEDCVVPYMDINKKKKHLKEFILIGNALEHMLLLTKNIPSKISRVCLMALAGRQENITESILVEEFLAYINRCERAVLKKGLENYSSLNDKEVDIIMNIFTVYQFFETPNAEDFKEQIMSIANDVLLEKPRVFIDEMRKGINIDKYDMFWKQCDFSTLTDMQKPTPQKVANCLTYDNDLNNEQTAVLHNLEMCIRCMDTETVTHFLFFVTGSYEMPYYIRVEFSNLVGLSERPIVSTCTNCITLPISYSNYQSLKKGLYKCLQSKEAYEYSKE